jgi:beta-glucosidase
VCVNAVVGGRRTRVAVAVCATLLALAAAAPANAAGRCGNHPWCDVYLSPDARAELLLTALTRDEKVGLLGGDELTGVAGGANTHTGTSDGVARVGLPPVYYSDGPVGPRQGPATSMPAPMSLAASFDRALARLHGKIVGNEVRLKGNDVVFAPTVNIMRTPLGGRTFESYGEDPFLQSRLGVNWIEGSQSEGVIGNVKHYAANNQEGLGVGPEGAPLGGSVAGGRYTVDTIVDERTLREIYLPHFEAAVKEANVGSVMCSYPRVNGQYACENKHLLAEVLRRDWGFKGYVLADYGAAKNTGDSIRNGLDFDPWPAIAYNPALVNAALAGGVPEADLDAAVRRTLRTLFAYGFFDRDAYVNDDSRVDKRGHMTQAGEIEQQGIVMLRNAGGVLPLERGEVRSIALIGEDADEMKRGGGSSNVVPYEFVTPRQGIEKRAKELGVEVRYDDGENAAAVAGAADVAVVVVADATSEGADKPCMGLNCGATDGLDRDALIDRVAAANKRTVVVLETGGPVLTPWRDRVAALVEAWYPGLDGGTAIARVLFGDTDPGGRLPVTFPKAESDEPYSGDPEAYPGVGERVVYKEGVFVGYRWFDEKGIEPAYPFGSGLSYTGFRYRNLRVTPSVDGPGATVSVEVTNTGSRRGFETPQLYLAMPDPSTEVKQPPRVLRGFEKLDLRAGETKTARFTLDGRSFSHWDTAASDWRIAPGCYDVMVGRSSRDIELRGVVAQGATVRCAGACLPALDLLASSARPRGRGMRIAPAGGAGKVSVEVFQQSRGDRVIRPVLVARFPNRSAGFDWNGAANVAGRSVSDGHLVVRFGGRGTGSHRVALVRRGGRFLARPAFQRSDPCALMEASWLSGPSFGGRKRRPLAIGYRLSRDARVTITVLRGRKVVGRFAAKSRNAGRHTVKLSSRKLKRGTYSVRVDAVAPDATMRSTLAAARL